MLKNYLVIAFRNLWRHRGQTAINMAGLALGMGCCLLIALYVRDELRFDRFHEQADALYRVEIRGEMEVTPAIVAPLARRALPDVVATTRLDDIGRYRDIVVRRGDRQFLESRFFYADSSVFDVFTFPLRAGVAATALVRPNTVVITPEMATKYFGDEEALGQQIEIGGRTFEVTGVLAPIPAASHLQFDLLASFATTGWATEEEWSPANFYTYFRLRPGADPAGVEAGLERFVADARAAGELDADYRLALDPVVDIHLGFEGRRTYVVLLASIGLLLLTIACVNYVNLSTARASIRAREVGIRKVSGAVRSQLFAQFLGESMAITLLSLGAGLILAAVFLPAFNDISGKQLVLFGDPAIGWAMGAVVLFVGVAGGIYPALLQASFGPADILKKARSSSGSGWLRRALVVFQFVATVVLLVATLVVYRQLDFVRTKDLGFDRDHVVTVPLPVGDAAVLRTYQAFRDALLQDPAFLDVAAVNHVPGYQRGGYGLQAEGIDFGAEEQMNIRGVPSDAHIVDALGLRLVAGENFHPVHTDSIVDGSYQYVLNEAAVKAVGWTPQEAVGKRVTLSGGRWGTVAGVIADYHALSLHEAIDPLAYFVEPWSCNYLVARVAPGRTREALAGLKQVWAARMPDRPFTYSFLDAQLDALYRNEQRAGRVFAIASVIAILIACMGLFSLAAFSAARRTKEMGIRKVLGASAPQLVALLSREFTVLVGVSFAVGAPIAYGLMRIWLQAFAYQIPLSWSLFAPVGAGVLVIAWLTVSYQAIRAALADPVESLRYE